MNIWSIIIIVLALVWGFVSQQWYVCGIKEKCDNEKIEKVVDAKAELLPISFRYRSAEPLVNDPAFLAYKTDLLNRKEENDLLIIEGQYYEGETEEVGRQRAKAVAALFSDDIAEDRIVIRTRKINQLKDEKASPFEATQLFWEERTDVATLPDDDAAPQETVPVNDKDSEPKESRVEELQDRIRIYHLFNSTQRTVDPDVDTYLNKLARRVQQTDERIQLTGHTDNIGGDDFNQELGAERAAFIKSILVKKGVSAAKISTATKGESQPIADNDTDRGRAQNRRTELVLVRN